VAGFGRGVYKSMDDGRSWTLSNTGITQSSIGNDADGAIYRSTDGAQNWTPVHMPKGVNAPNGLAIDPQSPRRLYLAAWARAVGLHGEGRRRLHFRRRRKDLETGARKRPACR
jgi:hypothetical protein